jgi:hypothetical protein
VGVSDQSVSNVRQLAGGNDAGDDGGDPPHVRGEGPVGMSLCPAGRWRIGAHGETATRRWAKRRESSSFWYGGLVGDEITFDCSIGAGPVHRDPLDSQPADRLEEAYR